MGLKDFYWIFIMLVVNPLVWPHVRADSPASAVVLTVDLDLKSQPVDHQESEAWRLFNQLSSQQKSELEQGQVITQEIKMADGPWPLRIVYQLIAAEPIESMAVFAAYDEQDQYVPGLVKSKVISEPEPGRTIVDYEFKLPWPLSNARYQNQHHLQKWTSGLVLHWEQIHSTSTKKNEGFMFFTSYQKKALMIYQTFVWPQSSFAKFLTKQSKKDLINFCQVLKIEIEKLKSHEPQKLKKYQERIEGALSGQMVYRPLVKQ